MSCACRCHAYGPGAFVTCDAGPEIPGGRSCATLHGDDAGDWCALGHEVERYVGLLCRAHYHRLGDTLRQIEELFALLPDVLEPGSGAGGRSATRVGSPAPGRLAAMAITDRRMRYAGGRDEEGVPDVPDVLGILEAWVGQVDEERGVLTRWVAGADGRAEHERDALAPGRLPLTTTTKRLHGERRWIAAQDWAGDYAEALADVHRALAAAVGDSMWPRPIGVCPNCQARMFPQPNGRVDEVTCHKCKTTWAGVHLARLRLIHEQEASA